MARITATRQVGPGQAPGQFAAPVSTGAMSAAQDLQRTGQAIQQAGELAGSIWTAEARQQNEARVNDALNRLQRYGQEQQAEYSQLRGENALRVDDLGRPVGAVYGERMDQQVEEIARDMRLNPVQLQAYRQRAGTLATEFRGRASNYELQQADQYRESVYASGVAIEQENILGAADDPAAIEIARLRITDLTNAEAERRGLSPEARQIALQTNLGTAHLQSIQARADEDPRGAQDYLDRYGDEMTPTQRAAARNATAGGLATQDAAAWVANLTVGAAPAQPGAPGASFQMPLPGVTMPGPGSRDYGERPRFRTSNGRLSSGNHDGVDLPAAAGTPVRAAAGGRVSRVVRSDTGYGNLVEIDHGNGTSTFYAHLQDFNVNEGDTVAPGQSFGRVGSTGNSTGPHLHMGARRNGRSINPAELFSEESRTAPGPTPNIPTRAEAERLATERFGSNPVQLNAARAEIARVYGLREAEQRDAWEAAETEAYAYIEANKRLPPASVMGRLRPGSQDRFRNYVEALTAPPVRRSDPSLELALAANLSWQDMTPEEFVGTYGSRLSNSDLISYVGALSRGRTQTIENLQKQSTEARIVPAEAFSRALTDTFDVSGVARVGTGQQAQTERQERALLVQSFRVAVLQEQQRLGRQMTEGEIRTLVNQRLGALAWERPRGLFSAEQSGFQTSYDTMTPANQRLFRQRLEARGERNPSEADIYEAYVLDRVNGVR